MAEYNINPFGVSEEVPSSFPIVNDLSSGGAYSALSAGMGKKLSAMTHKNTVFVAASDASAEDKLAADYQCTGTNDELVIQQAVNAVYYKGGGTVLLSNGSFIIDSFPVHDSADEGGSGSDTAILIPSDDTAGYEIKILGDTMPYRADCGTMFKVSNTCYNSLDSNKMYKVFRGAYSSSLANKAKVSLIMRNIGIYLAGNQKKIICIDLYSVNRVYLQHICCYGTHNVGSTGTGSLMPVAVEGCVGIRMTGGSNFGCSNDYKNILCFGLYEGFQVGGEHVIGVNLSALKCVYAFSFGNYAYSETFIHPITLLNCCDECCVNYPLFANCGDSRYAASEDGGQQISIIDYNIERYASLTPGGVLGEYATELRPGHFHGEISYTILTGTKNSKTEKFWKDGHGQRFISRNSAHLLAGGSTERRSYAPNYLQRYWDTDAGKELVCTDTANKTWRDTAGNVVS